MTFTAIDAWIGKTLFVPPIVKFCQATRQGQYAASRLFWFLVALDQLRLAETLSAQIFAGLFSLFMMLTASLRADMPAYSMIGFRLFAVALLVLVVMHGVFSGEWRGVEIWVLVLFAEYAATIRTIPPSETKQKAARAVRRRSS
ncbi:MAG: hypothetical protein JWL91_2139 [Sphingomonas bacterium]|jgi:hypothetical protein|nr:hypothetical protein [Sphingomonas bacterium]MDB5690263.1 hypothetical protein [Sphingomonas bacterium]